MTTDYEKVLEWFGWEGVFNGETTVWGTKTSVLSAKSAADILADPNLQARYFDPYILEKGYSFCIRQGDGDASCHIYGNGLPSFIVYEKAPTEALAKREAYIKLVGNEQNKD